MSGVDLIVEPDDGRRQLARAIREADRSVTLTMYLLTDRTLIRDLEYAHASGIDVRVILERHPYGAGDANQAAYDNLMAADVPVRWSNPRFLLTHEKAMVIDGASAYVMTTNFTRAAFSSNREFIVVDHNRRDVAAISALFERDWRGQPYAPRDGNLPLSPSDSRPLLAALIGSAHRTLDVYSEELQDPGMERLLAAAARRGVRVRLLLPAPSGPDLDAPGVAVVMAGGAQVRRAPASSLYPHAKAIVVDGRRMFIGSQNFSPASLDRNRELGVVVADRDAIATVEGTFAADWAHGRPSSTRPRQ